MQLKLFSLAFLLSVSANGQSVFTLKQCLDAAEKHQPIARQKAILDASQADALRLLQRNWFPQIALGAQATWQTAVTELPVKLPNFEVPTVSKDQYKLTLDLQQPIYDGGQNGQQKRVATAQAEAEKQSVSVSLYAVREQVLNLFCARLLAEKQSEIIEINRRDLSSRKTRLDESVKNGTAISANLQTIEVRLLELEQQADEARARLFSANDGLSILTGLMISENDKLALPEPPSESSGSEIGRPELSLFALQQKAVSEQSILLKSKLRPRANAFGTVGYGRPGLNFLSNEFEPYGIFGLNFRWNLTSFLNRSVNIERQQIMWQTDRVAAQRDQFLLQTSLRQSQQNREIVRLQEVLKKDETIISLRKNIAATAAIQLENGVLTASEYLTESTNETNARLSAAIHEMQLLQARLQSAFISGKL